MNAIAGMVAPIASTSLFALVVVAGPKSFWVGAPFFVATALSVVAISLAARTLRKSG